VADKVIDNPILNRPYNEPTRHFAFDDEGITDLVEDSRRPSSFFVPVPRLRKGTRQLELAELIADQIWLNDLVNRIREQVTRWRHAGYPRVTPEDRQTGTSALNPRNCGRAPAVPHPSVVDLETTVATRQRGLNRRIARRTMSRAPRRRRTPPARCPPAR